MKEAEVDSAHCTVHTLCLQKRKKINSRSSVSTVKIYLILFHFQWTLEVSPWRVRGYLGRQVLLFPLLALTVRKTAGTCPPKQVLGWICATQRGRGSRYHFPFHTLCCTGGSHNILAVSRLQLYAVITPGSCQDHHNLIYIPPWKRLFSCHYIAEPDF